MSDPAGPARCAACPIAEGFCAGLRHRRYCENMAAEPERWRPEVLKATPIVATWPEPYQPPPIERRFPKAPPSSRVLIRAHLYPHGGYGQIAEWLGRSLDALGVPVAYQPLSVETEYLPLPGFVRDRIDPDPADDWELLLDTPDARILPGRSGVHFSMWEVSRVRPDQARNFAAAEAVATTCEFSRQCFEASGAGRPIRLVPIGISGEEGYRPTTPPARRPFVVGTAGRMAHGGDRKGLVPAARAFLAAFPTEADVRLRIKCLPDCLPKLSDLPSDPRIELHTDPLTPAEMAEFSRSCTVGLFMTCGEGWGMHIHQFMAVGRPVIVPMVTGVAEYCDESCGWPLDYRWTPARDFYTGAGEWAEPEHESAVALLRRAYENHAEVEAKGNAAASRAAEFGWDRTGRELLAALREFGMLARGRGDEPPLPSLWQQARNFIPSVVTHITYGRRQADEATRAARLALCEACDHLRPSDRRCGMVNGCGCGCPVDAKASWASESCPAEKWGPC